MNYETFLQKVESGCRYRIDLLNKTLKINGKTVKFDRFSGNWQTAEELYAKFKYSAPCEHSNGNTPYFKALRYEDISDNELVFNENRNITQAMLEGYLLMADMEWQNNEHWFRKGTDEDFIVLKDWVNKEKK